MSEDPISADITGTTETQVSKYFALQDRLHNVEAKLRGEMVAVRKEWEKWALAHIGETVGNYQGVFTGIGADGEAHTRKVLVHLGYDSSSRPQIGLQEMFIINEGDANKKIGVAMDLGSFSVGTVVVDNERVFPRIAKYPLDSYRSIMWGGGSLIDFDKQTQAHPELAPNFAGMARQELAWLNMSSGVLQSSKRYL